MFGIHTWAWLGIAWSGERSYWVVLCIETVRMRTLVGKVLLCQVPFLSPKATTCTSSVAPSPGKIWVCELHVWLGSALTSGPFPMYLSFSLADLCYESLSHHGLCCCLFHQGEAGCLAVASCPPCICLAWLILRAPFTKTKNNRNTLKKKSIGSSLSLEFPWPTRI